MDAAATPPRLLCSTADHALELDSNDVLDLLYVYLISLAAGAFTIFPVLRRMGLGFDWRDAVLTWVAGLRGVVGLSMAMIVHFSARDGHELERTGQRFMFSHGRRVFLDGCHQCHGVHTSLSLPRVGREASCADHRHGELV